MKKAYLNKAQKKWICEFLSTRPNSRHQVYTIDNGTRTVNIEWYEKTNIIILDAHTYIATNIDHKLIVTLRMSGRPSKDGEYSFNISPPQKYQVSYNLNGQFALDIPTNYTVKFPKNPVIIRQNNSINNIKKTVKRIVRQQTLTLDKYTQRLQDINLSTKGNIKSKEELLEISTTSDIKLPKIIITMLINKNVSENELIIASQVYISGGVESVLDYLEMIELLRKQKH
ncbi:MAG: hypothetical protein HC815_05830 [Richelia sp. RM1_1_1]|nr:hypothetical protein [Richelia sp. RM1_1_1]